MPTSSETIAYLGLGSNMGESLGDREAQLEKAVEAISKLPATRLLRRSPVYESKPWGQTNQPDFLNMVVEVSTRLEPHLLRRHCAHIEEEMGRVPGEKWGPRPIDIDILLFGDRRIRTSSLEVPHPRMWERRFVLRPLADLVPDAVGPDGTPIKKLLEKESIASQGVWDYSMPRIGENENKEG